MVTQDDVRRLEHEFADAMQRLYSVGNGLARLRADLDPATTAHLAAAPVPTASAPTAPPSRAPAAPRPRVPAAALGATGSAAPAGPPRVPWYRREGAVTRVLAVAGAVVTLAGVAMLLVIAARHGWFGPVARVAAGGVLAAVLGGLGARGGSLERSRGGAVGAAPVALVATGAAAAYLDVVAMTSWYGWLPAAWGLAAAGVVALAGLWLARRWDSEQLAVLMVAGAAGFSPVVAGGAGWVLSAFLGVLALAGWWAGGERTRPALTVVRSMPVALSLVVGAAATPDERVGLLGVAVVVLLVTLATAALSVRRDPADVTATLSLSAACVALLVVTGVQPDAVRPTLHALAAAVLLLAASALARPPLGPLAGHLVVATATGGTVSAVLAVVTGAPSGHVTTGLLLLAAGHLAASGVGRSALTLSLGAGTAALALLGWLQHPLAVVDPTLATRHDMGTALLDSVLAAAVAGLLVWATALVRGVGRDVRLAAVVVAWVVGLGASATALVALGVLVGDRTGDPRLGFLVGHAAATVTWMLAAGWLLLRSLRGGRLADLALRTGLLLSGVAVAKLFLFDLAALSGIVRSVAFIATGLLLLATGSRYARALERGRAGA
jgi:hypothetical protein